MTETILVVNAGSSSIKFQTFEVAAHDRLERGMKGQIEGIGTRPRLTVRSADRQTVVDTTWPAAEASDVPAALDKVVGFLRGQLGGKCRDGQRRQYYHHGP